MGDNLKKLAGGKLEAILAKLTSGKIKGFLLGFIVTAVIQSSSATTVMLIGFVNAGIMQFGQTIGVVFGANLGTTVTAWILSLGGIDGNNIWLDLLKPTSFTPVLMIVGFIMMTASKSDKRKSLSLILIGFSALMFGMNMMSNAMSGLENNAGFREFLLMFSNPVLGIFIGAIFTAIIQSSSASVGILQAMSLTGAIPYSIAIPIVFGENIGAAVTPILSAITGNTESKRVAFCSLYVKIIGAAGVSIIFYTLNFLFDFGFMDSNVTMVTIAIIHTLFNLIDAVLLLPFSQWIEKLTTATIRGKKTETYSRFDTLDQRFLSVPTFAIEKCRELVCEMAQIAQKTVVLSMESINQYDEKKASTIQENENLVDMYEDKLSTHFVKLSGQELSGNDSKSLTKLMHCIGDIERIADHAVNISAIARELQEKQIQFSDAACHDLQIISTAVTDVLHDATEAFLHDDITLAKNVEPLEQVIDRLKIKIKDNHIVRLQNGQCSVVLGFILSDLLNNYARIADHCSNIAVCLIELSHGSFETHEYLNNVKQSDEEFIKLYEFYKKKYLI